MAGQPNRSELIDVVDELCAFPRPSASDGERRAAELLAARLRALGLARVRVEQEAAVGGYWWPLGLLSAASGVAALAGGRLVRTAVGALCALGIFDELGLFRGVWTRRLLPKRPTYNVVAEAGDPDATHAVVVVAHHDAAHGGAVFDPTVPHLIGRRLPRVLARARSWPRILALVNLGPVLVALGLRRAGALVSFGSAAAFADIGVRSVVPGANDNVSGVALLVGLARSLAERPVRGLRVVLLSAGSEEAFEEGSRAFLRRHRADLPPERTRWLAIDTVGSGNVVLVEGEGMVVRAEYDRELKETLAAAAADAGVDVIREHWLSYGSDALAGLRAGYRSALVASFDAFKLPANYHQPTDTPANVDVDCVQDALRVVDAAVRRMAASA